MTTNVKLFQSTDAGAPVLSGAVGALTALLDACLVDGYNSGAVTITRSGSTATATRTAHGYAVGDCVLVAGATETEYNGEAYITAVTADTFDYAVTGTPASPATGTITAERAAAGWTKAFSGSNLAAYRQGGGNQFYLRVDDTASGAANYARVVGYESMTDINTGTAPFPTAAQASGGLYAIKSNQSTSATRPWVVLATDRFVIMLVDQDATANSSIGWVFGDINSYKSGDAFHTLIIAHHTSAATSNNFASLSTNIAVTTTAHYLARSHTQIGGSVLAGKHTDAAKSAATTIGAGGMTYPNPSDGGLYLSPVWVHETSNLRGEIPGLWCPAHNKPLGHGDTFSGAGTLAGKTFLVWNQYSNGQVFLETSNTWGA